MSKRLSLSLSIAALALTACGGWKRTGTSPGAEIGGAKNIATVEITLANVTREQGVAFIKQLDDHGDIKTVVMKSYQEGVAVYDVEVEGCECEVPAMVARIPSPGFKYQGRLAKFRYSAFDNIPPKLTFVKPASGAVLK